MSGPFYMSNHVNLQIDAGATLKFLTESKYPNSSINPITGNSLTDIEFSGSGTIDGNGATWWSFSTRPYMIYLNKCLRVLFENVTLQNPPKMHIVFKSWMGYVTISNITINTLPTAPYYAPNTDGIDLIGTNCLIENCRISGGDDNIAIGSSSTTAHSYNIEVTNCIFGYGHGLSIGSSTLGGVSNLNVINCVWTNTDFGIRMKSDNQPSGASGGVGGVAVDLNYYNLAMTNVGMPLLIFSYYATTNWTGGNLYPPSDDISPLRASTQAVANASLPVWGNITISNLTAKSCGESLIWGRIEAPVTNVSLINYKTISAFSGSSYNFGIYNAYGVNIINSAIATASGLNTFSLYNAGVTISNATSSTVSMDGLPSASSLALYNTSVNLGDPALYGASPLTVSGCTLTDSNSLTLGPTNAVNFVLGTAASEVGVNGSLTLNSPTFNIASGTGFGTGTYTLFSCSGGSLSGSAVLGTTPAGFNYTLTNNSAAGQVNLLVTSTNSVTGTMPAITNQPASQGFYTGDSATFISGASGTAPLMYQWYFNTNSILAAATNSSLILTNLQTTNAGAYDVIVTNASGSATSAVANLTVILPPKFASTALSGGSLVVSGNGGLPNSNYIVLATTNLALPSSQWTPVATNPFSGAGSFSFTNTAATNPHSFFRMQLP
jgi:hypothetical protein